MACAKVGAYVVPVDGDALAESADLGGGPRFVHERLLEPLGAAGLPVESAWAVGAGVGGRLTQPGAPALSFAEEVAAFGDDYDDPTVRVSDRLIALPGERQWCSQASVMAAAERLKRSGVGAEQRLLVDASADQATYALIALTMFAVGASLVAVRHPDPAALMRHAGQERVGLAVVRDELRAELAAAPQPEDFFGFASAAALLAGSASPSADGNGPGP